MEDVGEERREIDLPRRQALDDAHGRTAAGTWPRSRRVRWRGRWRWIGRAGQGAATLWELHRARARGEEAEVADAHEPPRQDVQQEAPKEFPASSVSVRTRLPCR
jgi:hypothetical protein